jgi:hypothetical protein
MVGTHHKGDKKGRSKKGQNMNSPQELKKGRDLVPLVVGSYMTPLMSLKCKSWDLIVMGGLEQASPVNTIFFPIAKAKAP